MGELAGREIGEVLVVFADDPPNGPRLLIAAVADRVLIAVPLLALVDAGESPWARLREAGRPCEGDPHGYRGSALSLDMDGRTVVYRVGEYVPSQHGYIAERGAAPDCDHGRMTTGEIGPAKALACAVAEYLTEEYGPPSRRSLPAGIRLELHPRVYYAIMNDPDTCTWPREPGDAGEEMLPRTFRLPVKVTPELPTSTWRLVIITEDVRLGGGLP